MSAAPWPTLLAPRSCCARPSSPCRPPSGPTRTLTRLAGLGERAGRVFTLENLDAAVDHPGTPFAKAADALALVGEVQVADVPGRCEPAALGRLGYRGVVAPRSPSRPCRPSRYEERPGAPTTRGA
jgi:hypothetical protein